MNSEALNIIAKEMPSIAAILLVMAAFLLVFSRMSKEMTQIATRVDAKHEAVFDRMVTVVENNTKAFAEMFQALRANTEMTETLASEVRELQSLLQVKTHA